jgi:hypothetical protein
MNPPLRLILLWPLLLLAAGMSGTCGVPSALQEQRALVVYNLNAGPDALAVAAAYAAKRNVPGSHLCAVELPVGQYASKDELLGARRTIVEKCLCGLIPAAMRPSPCNSSNVDAIRAHSPITHLVLIRGIPPRLFGTGWPSDSEEPSFDFYLSYLIYRDEDIFAPGQVGAVTNTYLTEDLLEQAYATMVLSAPPLDPTLHRELAYGRIEAMDLDRTLDLIDRTLAAEAAGITGNFLEEKDGRGFAFLRDLTGSLDPACADYITYEPFVFDTPESSWDPASCRAGTTFVTAEGPDPNSSNDDPQRSVVPGSGHSTVPRAVSVGLMLGSAANPNSHSGFNSFGVLTQWRRTNAPCTPLCQDLTSQAERDACAASSTDYFHELDTSCVGAAPGLIGHQVRSYPVQYYGFMPPGWNADTIGSAEKTPAHVATGDAYQDPFFTDDRYLHLGQSGVASPDASQCTLEDGSAVACPERIALDISRSVSFAPPLAIGNLRTFLLQLRHRNAPNPAGAALQVVVTFHSGAQSLSKTASIPLGAGASTWTLGTTSVAIDPGELAQVDAIDLRLAIGLGDGVRGFLDLDGVALWDLESGIQLIDPEAGSFTANHHSTAWGDYAANAIDRLGAIAWWGSSSHHLGAGYAFSDDRSFYGAFFMGRTLGESLLLAGGGESGIVYGDPLYRPVAVRIHIPGANGYGEAPGLAVDPGNVDAYGTVLLNVLDGTSHVATVRWSVATCPVLDAAQCGDAGLWTERASGTGALENEPFHWTSTIDPDVAQDVLIRLRVWNPGQEGDALFHYAYFSYSPS